MDGVAADNDRPILFDRTQVYRTKKCVAVPFSVTVLTDRFTWKKLYLRQKIQVLVSIQDDSFVGLETKKRQHVLQVD
jgi:hypothetical protein